MAPRPDAVKAATEAYRERIRETLKSARETTAAAKQMLKEALDRMESKPRATSTSNGALRAVR